MKPAKPKHWFLTIALLFQCLYMYRIDKMHKRIANRWKYSEHIHKLPLKFIIFNTLNNILEQVQ